MGLVKSIEASKSLFESIYKSDISDDDKKIAREIQTTIINAEESLLTWADVEKRVGFSRSTAWRKMKKGNFPKPVQSGSNAVHWKNSDITNWISSLDYITVA